jgi:hypothetical protein
MRWSIKTWAVYAHNAMLNGRTARQACQFLRATRKLFDLEEEQRQACSCTWYHYDYEAGDEQYL